MSIEGDRPVALEGITLIIPAYNEEDRIPATLESYLPVLRATGQPFDVVVIIDGEDNTLSVVEHYKAQGVTAYVFPDKLGRGGATLQGFRKARRHIVAVADADGSIPAKDFARMLSMVISGERAVIASRRLDRSTVIVPEPQFRRFISWTWHALVKATLSIPVKDAQCGLKIFTQDVVQLVLRKVVVTNRTFEVGMLYHIISSGYHIREVPVAYVHDFRTRMPITKAIPIMFATLLGMFVSNRTRTMNRLMGTFLRSMNQKFAAV